VVEGGFAPGNPATPWNLKDRLAALGSNRIGLDLRCSRLAQRSCWPVLPSWFEAYFVNVLGRCAVWLAERTSVDDHSEHCLAIGKINESSRSDSKSALMSRKQEVAGPYLTGRDAHAAMIALEAAAETIYQCGSVR
jgi:hypothetical protein